VCSGRNCYAVVDAPQEGCGIDEIFLRKAVEVWNRLLLSLSPFYIGCKEPLQGSCNGRGGELFPVVRPVSCRGLVKTKISATCDGKMPFARLFFSSVTFHLRDIRLRDISTA